ncbi:alpha/beta fold hydrolase [Streptomyces sp. NPDC017520]|uniref:alpha/beta fold hydrolase n=1 Tax=Streptomyces sp. NPDC017520 TaxID=3364998 RepID=UPI003794BF7E
MRSASATPSGDRIRWVELPGAEPSRVYVHGLGATSPAYFAESAAHPLLAGRRSLLIDMLGFGISDRPVDFDYTLDAHADALAAALEAAGVVGAELIAHSMGGSVAIVLATRHPHLVSRLVLVDANLDPVTPAPGPGSAGIAHFTEEEFLAGGWQKVRDAVGAHWWSTMRLASLEALHRSAVHLARGGVPPLRTLLTELRIPRTYVLPENTGPLPGSALLEAAGVRVVPIADCGHNIMLDNHEAFVRATAEALAAWPGPAGPTQDAARASPTP